MQISPKIRGFICTTAHPKGCRAHVQAEIEQARTLKDALGDAPKRVLVIGASTGYGLSSRICAAFGADASTLGVFYEKPPTERKTASAGWYNTVAFEQAAHAAGLYAKSINGDAFSDAIKHETLDLIEQDLGQIDCLIYSLASPRRIMPETGEVVQSTLKPVGTAFSGKTLNPLTGEVSEVTLEPATVEEVENTITVMGGDDWQRWVSFLKDRNLLAEGFQTVAYSYLGPELTHPIYRAGTIGHAKVHLETTARDMTHALSSLNGNAWVSVNKALVTQASSAIPVVPLYMALLFSVMKEKGTHEGCIEQIVRLFKERLYPSDRSVVTDENHLIRMDDWEMDHDVQAEVAKRWRKVSTENLSQLGDCETYLTEFHRLFGFQWPGVDEQADLAHDLWIPSIAKPEA